MAISASFKTAVSSGDVRGIRIMMKDSLLVDPSFAEFDEMARLASNVSGLYDTHDGREFESDKSAWDDNYMNKQMVQVVGNFSRERINHLNEVVCKLRPATEHPQSSTNSQRNSSGHSSAGKNMTQYGSYRGAKIMTGVVAGAVVGGTVAVVASATIIGGATIGAVVGGVAVAVATNGE